MVPGPQFARKCDSPPCGGGGGGGGGGDGTFTVTHIGADFLTDPEIVLDGRLGGGKKGTSINIGDVQNPEKIVLSAAFIVGLKNTLPQ